MRALLGALGLLVLVPLAGCSSQTDACAGQPTGSCITLEISGPSGAQVDAIGLVATGAFSGQRTSMLHGPQRLPVRMGVVPPSSAMVGDQVGFTVTGVLDGATVGVGTGSDTLTATDRHLVHIELLTDGPDGGEPFDGGDMAGDGGEPQACNDEGAVLGCSGDGSAVLTCSSAGTVSTESCPLGCVGTGSMAHCNSFVPHAPVTPSMLTSGATGMVTLSGNATIDTNDGTISPPATGVTIAMAGSTVILEVASLTVAKGATVNVIGTHPLVIVASQDIVIHGVLDARSAALQAGSYVACLNLQAAGPGGAPGGGAAQQNGYGVGSSNTGGGGAGGGTSGVSGDGGGGGGGNAAVGGPGGAGSANGSAQGMVSSGGAEVVLGYPILGGAGGGANIDGANFGGGGGGAVHLVAGRSIQIGEVAGATGGALEGINVSGCGGGAATLVSTLAEAPGGGGAGGTILLEAPAVTLGADSALTANGGAGGGGGPEQGKTSSLGDPPPSGQAEAHACAMAGGGGGGTTPAGGTGTNGFSVSGDYESGGGGGGASGRIILFDATGAIDAGNANLSPALEAGSTACFVNKLTIQ